jgi:glucose 1-dehydrogenase
MPLKGKVAIVTGGNSGIGQAIVLELARQHANVVIDYVCHPSATEALEQQVAKLGDQSIGVEADVSKLADLQMLVDHAVSKFGRADIMVNNAGVETRTSVLDTTEGQYEKVMAINLKSAFFGTQIAAQQMIKQGGGGRIINVTSVHEDWPMPGNTAYCLSKGGMRMLTRTSGSSSPDTTSSWSGWVRAPSRRQSMSEQCKIQQSSPAGQGDTGGSHGASGGDCSGGRLSCRGWGELPHSDHHLRRWRYHAQQRRSLAEPSRTRCRCHAHCQAGVRRDKLTL